MIASMQKTAIVIKMKKISQLVLQISVLKYRAVNKFSNVLNKTESLNERLNYKEQSLLMLTNKMS